MRTSVKLWHMFSDIIYEVDKGHQIFVHFENKTQISLPRESKAQILVPITHFSIIAYVYVDMPFKCAIKQLNIHVF